MRDIYQPVGVIDGFNLSIISYGGIYLENKLERLISAELKIALQAKRYTGRAACFYELIKTTQECDLRLN